MSTDLLASVRPSFEMDATGSGDCNSCAADGVEDSCKTYGDRVHDQFHARNNRLWSVRAQNLPEHIPVHTKAQVSTTAILPCSIGCLIVQLGRGCGGFGIL